MWSVELGVGMYRAALCMNLILVFCLDVGCFLVISYKILKLFLHDFTYIRRSTRYFGSCWNKIRGLGYFSSSIRFYHELETVC